MVIEGRAYIPSIDIGKRKHSSKIVLLRPRNRRRPPIVLPARSFLHPDATEQSGQDRYSYDWAGFRCRDQPALVPLVRPLDDGRSGNATLLVRSRGVWRPARIHTPLARSGGAARHSARWRPASGFGRSGKAAIWSSNWSGCPRCLPGTRSSRGATGRAVGKSNSTWISPAWRKLIPAAPSYSSSGKAAPSALSFPASVTAITRDRRTVRRSGCIMPGAVRLSGTVDLDALTAGADRAATRGGEALAGCGRPVAG